MLIPPIYTTSAASTFVSVTPADCYAAVGKTVNVTISITDVGNLTAWQFTLYFLNGVLNCTNVAEGPFLKSVNATYFGKTITNNYNNTHGELVAYCTLLGNTSVANGSGVLAIVTFNASSVADSPLHLSDTILCDQNIPPKHIPHTDVDGTVHVQNFTLTVTTDGSGTVALNDTGPYYYFYEAVQLTATPAVGWSFDHWSGNLIGSTTPATLIVTGNMSVKATFIQNQYTLNVTIFGSGTVSKSPDQATYTYGNNVTLNASASSGWTFAAWSGDASGSVNPVTVNMTDNKSVTATFTQNVYTLSLSVVGNGSVNLNNTGPYHYGDAVLLTPIPSSYWSFDHWSGDLTGSANPATLIVTANMSVTATFTQVNYTLTVGTYGNGYVILNNTGPYYHYGDVVLLTAVPDAHWIFNYWSGNLVGSISIAALVITGNMSVTANFVQIPYWLTINVIGSGSVAHNGTAPYHYGDVVQLNATAPTGWTFQGWTEDLNGSTNPTTILIDGNKVVNATFTQNQYTLNLTIVGCGQVQLSPNATYYYYGVLVQLTAVPAVGWSFDHWSGDLTGSVNPRFLNITRNMSVSATFAPTNYTLGVWTVRMGSVSLNSTPPYHYGDAVLLIATPNSGWSFEYWTGDLNGSANPATLVITRDMSVTAWFVKNVYTLTVNIDGTGSVTLNNTGPYDYGDAVLLTAVPIGSASFDHWSGDLTGSANPATLVIATNMSVTAYFTVEPTLMMSPTNTTCRVYGEDFAVTVVVSGAVNVENSAFEIHYNTTLLDYMGVTWNAWGLGTINVNESAGVISGSTSGSPLNGTQTLITIEFEATYYHMWKSTPGWANDLTETIFFQWVNLSFPSGPDLRYEKGGLNQINVGPDFLYTFSPIQGDLNNDGIVDIFDLRTVGAYFGTSMGDPDWTQASTYDLNGDGTIDVLDLEVVTANYGYTYTP